MGDEVIGIEFQPLTTSNFSDFEKLFGKSGACGGCWCMYWLIAWKDYEANKGEGNHLAMKQYVESGHIPGVLAYFDHEPVGWCAFAPREEYLRLKSSRILKPVDEEKVWSLVCFYVHRRWRGKGVQTQLLKFVLEYCKGKGAKIVEGYPHDPVGGKIPDAFAWTGTSSAFLKVGFREVARRSASRPIMRYEL